MLNWIKRHPRKAVALGLTALLVISFAIPFHGQIPEKAKYAGDSEHSSFNTVATYVSIILIDFFDNYAGAITGIATAFLAYITFGLVNVSKEQARIAREIHEARRAYIFAVNISSELEYGPIPGQYSWRLRPEWRNSGDTPSKSLRIYCECELLNAPLPGGFNFDRTVKPPGPGLLPPRYSMAGGAAPMRPNAPISPQDIIDVQNGRKFLYLWGWARYFDVFQGARQHLTRFCFQIFPVGDAFAFVPGSKPGENGSLHFPYVHHVEGNCADEECGG